MNVKQDQHLDESQILLSLVDEGDLPGPARAHLAACPECQAARRSHVEHLERLANLARQAAPRPSRPITLPREAATVWSSRCGFGWAPSWKPALGLALVVLVVLVTAILWWKPGQDRQLASLNREWREDRTFMDEVQRLETDALPSLYGAIAGDDSLDSDENPWDWMVPATDADNLSIHRFLKENRLLTRRNTSWLPDGYSV